jgi:hypothetical protein
MMGEEKTDNIRGMKRVLNIDFFNLRIPLFLLFFASAIYSFYLLDDIFSFPDIILLNLGFILLAFLPLPDVIKVFFSLWLSFFVSGFSILRVSNYSIVNLSDIGFLMASFILFIISFLFSLALILLFKYRLELRELSKGRKEAFGRRGETKFVSTEQTKREFLVDQLKRKFQLLSQEIESDLKLKHSSILKRRDEIFKSIELNKKNLLNYYSILHRIRPRIFNEIQRDKEFKNLIDSFLEKTNTSFTDNFSNVLSDLDKINSSITEINFAQTPISSLRRQREDFNIQSFRDKIEEFNRSNLVENIIFVQRKVYGLKSIFYSFQKIMQDFSRIPHTCYSISIKVLQIASSSGDSDVRRNLSAIVQDIDSFSFKVSVNIKYILSRMQDFENKLLSFSEAFELEVQKIQLLSISINDIGSRYVDLAKNRIEFFNEQYEKILGEADKFSEMDKEINSIFLRLKEVLVMSEDIKNRVLSLSSAQWLLFVRKELDNRIQILSEILSLLDNLLKNVSEYIEDINSITLPDILIYYQGLKSVQYVGKVNSLMLKI